MISEGTENDGYTFQVAIAISKQIIDSEPKAIVKYIWKLFGLITVLYNWNNLP